jgi:hypothetical protein
VGRRYPGFGNACKSVVQEDEVHDGFFFGLRNTGVEKKTDARDDVYIT